MDQDGDYDAIVVGSGFGGAVAAARLAQAGLRIAILERGRRWPRGSFPRDSTDLRAMAVAGRQGTLRHPLARSHAERPECRLGWRFADPGNGVRFRETMTGSLGVSGGRRATRLTLDAHIPGWAPFLRDAVHPVSLSGTVDIEGLATARPATGTLELFPDPGDVAMRYRLHTSKDSGEALVLIGTKRQHRRNPFRLWSDLTTLQVEAADSVGVLRISLSAETRSPAASGPPPHASWPTSLEVRCAAYGEGPAAPPGPGPRSCPRWLRNPGSGPAGGGILLATSS